MKFGYGRVSSKDQNLSRQIQAFIKEGVDERNIYVDKQSGKNMDRANYQMLTRRLLRQDDLLVIDSLDRLGRNYIELKEEWHHITKKIKCRIKVLDFPLLDTSSNNDITNQLIVDIVFSLLCYIAEKERIKILQRQREGIDVCLANQGREGVKHYGRPKILYPTNFVAIIEKWENKEIKAKEAREQLNLKKNTFYNLYREYRQMNDDEKLALTEKI